VFRGRRETDVGRFLRGLALVIRAIALAFLP
jgi:hypothetical protein